MNVGSKKLTEKERKAVVDDCKPPASFMDAVERAFAGDTAGLADILGAIDAGITKAEGEVR